MTLETKFGIGDVVYMVCENDIKKHIINRIRVSGLKHEERYGFEGQSHIGLLFWSNSASAESWFSLDDIFATEKEALVRQKELTKKAELQAQKDKIKNISRLRESVKEAQERLERAESGIDEEDDDTDDED